MLDFSYQKCITQLLQKETAIRSGIKALTAVFEISKLSCVRIVYAKSGFLFGYRICD